MGGSLRSYISIIAIELDIIKIVARSQVSKPLVASPTFARSALLEGSHHSGLRSYTDSHSQGVAHTSSTRPSNGRGNTTNPRSHLVSFWR